MNEYLQNSFFYKGKEELLFDNKNCFQVIEIKNIEDLIPFSTTEIKYSYRGQASKDWLLKTTIERFFENRNILISKTNIEENILRKYYSESSIFSNELGYDPKSQTPLDALADIQHYGGPTRLLDFTSSFNKALFFATFNNYKTDSSVYCLRNLMFNVASFDINDFLKGQPMSQNAKESLPPIKDKNRVLKFHTPERKNRRLQNQNGYFIYPGSVENSFEECLSYTFGNMPIVFNKQSTPDINEIVLRSTIIKVIIPKEMHSDIMRYLKNIGISAFTLYPDYYGAIQSLYEIETDRI